MIRQPAFETVVSTLTQAFATAGVDYGRQRTLNLAAELQGYKNYAHYLSEATRKTKLSAPALQAAAPAPTPDEGPSQVVLLRDSLVWLITRTKQILSRTPVRDMDECLLHAELMVRKASE